VTEQIAAAGVRGLHPYVPGKPIDALEREYGIRDSIKLASNENPLGPPAAALDAVRRALPEMAFYPDGSSHYLKAALAAKLDIDPACLTVGNGSNDLLVLLAETFLTPAVEAVFDQHTFVVNRLVVQATDAIARVAPSLPPASEMPLGHDLAAFISLLGGNTRLVFIPNPNNPTGTWVSAAALRAFLEQVPNHVIVVVDEAYGEYVTLPDYPPTLEWLDRYPNLVVLRTFSKIYALAGLRVGYAISHPNVAELLNRVRQPFNVNRAAQEAAIAAIQDDAFVARSREINQSGLAQLADGLRDLGLDTLPSIGNFVLADLTAPAGPLYEALLRDGIIVRPVGNYGLPNHLRITVGLPEQNARLLASLRSIIGTGGSGL
jgi:histidinol-phosphate aminotransferase